MAQVPTNWASPLKKLLTWVIGETKSYVHNTVLFINLRDTEVNYTFRHAREKMSNGLHFVETWELCWKHVKWFPAPQNYTAELWSTEVSANRETTAFPSNRQEVSNLTEYGVTLLSVQ